MLTGNRARPREKFNLWMGSWKRLPNKDRLAKIGVVVDQKCCFCDSLKSMEHLLFECHMTNGIWKQVLEWLQLYRRPRVGS